MLQDLYRTLLIRPLADCTVYFAKTTLTNSFFEMIVLCGASMDDPDEAGNVNFELSKDSGAINAVVVDALTLLCLFLCQQLNFLFEQVHYHAVLPRQVY